MKTKILLLIILIVTSLKCRERLKMALTDADKLIIAEEIQKEIDTLLIAVKTKDIELYMKKMPKDFIIYDNNGTELSREQQKEFALRDWSIIDSTLYNTMLIDSITFISRDSIYLYTYQEWKRFMFQRDGITIDTVLTTQKHRELWKKKEKHWIGYNVEELGGDIFINGKVYILN